MLKKSNKAVPSQEVPEAIRQEQQQLLKQKQYRQEKAAAKFSKERFFRTAEPEPQRTTTPEPVQPSRRSLRDKLKLENLKFDIMVALRTQGVDFDDPQLNVEWLNLSFYDDREYETVVHEDQLSAFVGQENQSAAGVMASLEDASARCLVRLAAGHQYVRGTVLDYSAERGKFLFCFEADGKQRKLYVPRVYICFDVEDPVRYCERLCKAFISRLYADSLIKFDFYVKSMPKEHLSQISEEQRKKIFELVHRSKRFANEDLEGLFRESKVEYLHTMNSIILRKCMIEMKEDIIPHGLMLPPVPPKELPDYYGMLPLQAHKGAKELVITDGEAKQTEPRSFLQTFQEFCEWSVLTSRQVIFTFEAIRTECEQLKELELFKIDLSTGILKPRQTKQPLRYEHFQTDQNIYIQKMMNRIKTGWAGNIRELVEKELNKENISSSWFTVNQSLEQYEQSKFRRYFKRIKLMMEDSLLTLSQKSFGNFCRYIKGFIPDRVVVKSASQVVNYYEDGSVVDSQDPSTYQSVRCKLPLFQTDLMRSLDDSSFSYATSPQNFLAMVLGFFDRMLQELSRIPEIEQKCMAEQFKKKKERTERYLRSPSRTTPDQPLDENLWVKQLYADLRQKLEGAIEPIVQYLSQFDSFLEVLRLKPDEYVKQIEKEDEDQPKEVEALKEEIESLYKKESELLKKMPDSIQVSFFRIHFKDVNEKLAAKYNTAAKGLESLIAKKAKKASRSILEKYDQIRAKIKADPKDIEKLVETKEFMNSVPLELEKLRRETEESNSIYTLLDEFRHVLPSDDIKKKYQIMLAPKEILQEIEKKTGELSSKKQDFESRLKAQQEEFKGTVEGLSRTVSQFHMYNRRQQHAEIAEKVELINKTLTASVQDAKLYNSREGLFDKEITDYSKVQQLMKDFQPYSNLWLVANQWVANVEKWQHDDWEKLDAEECERFVEDSIKSLQAAIRYFTEKDIQPVLRIAKEVKAEIDEFRKKVPLMVALRKKGMTDRHWTEISQKIGIRVEPGPGFTFNKVLELGLMKHLDTCVEIGEKASKEFVIETNLNAMIERWDEISFGFAPFKTSFIIKGFDDVMAVLDEHIANTQAMQFSPFKRPFEEQIVKWNDTLKRMSDTIEEWTKLQVNWMYLQPIFDSPDIAKQLPNESKKFKGVDAFWKGLLNKSRELGNVEKICEPQDQLKNIRDNNALLDLIQKELNSYLEKKREKFARFFFLGNNELLEILSQTKEPTAVQPYLKKVFENINEVEFDSKGTKTILAMFSAEHERIAFTKIVDPKNKNVEDWMTEVQQQMKLSVRASLLHSMLEYVKVPRQKWVMEHPGQCVLNGSQIHWTAEVEEQIKGNSIAAYFQKLNEQLNRTVELVRVKLSKNQSVTLNALIVIDVHAKDVVENLLKNGVNDLNAFEWISQLRYYWEQEECQTKCVQTVFPYGYEYLGNTLRLVITPLTDKCYMTLMGALKLNLGGAPAGPAGTGKTQTTKDLAKALAKQCVVFNCSDSMDFIMVGKFFKGLASAGAWACFDEFNRINIEVLSVIAQQLLVLFGEKAKNSPRVQFEGSDIKLQPTFSVFITMNPGYAGRTELPDNLKALFRPVAMMVPDYAMIGEILLYSFGFKKGRELAKKMVATFKLASQQLSSQDHYDYGMRAVRSVINAAGILKERDQDMEEDQLLLRALRDVNVPKFLKDDLPLFENIIKDLFPGVSKPNIDYGKLLTAIHASCALPEFNLEPIEPFITKIIQLFDTIQVRHGLMLVGPTGGGKTSNYNILKTALSSLVDAGYYKVNTRVLNPKSITMGQLYGMFNETTREWIDGVLAYTVRECCKDRSSQKYWVMFDGPVDALWIENMNTVLDDNKKLCLNSGQILTLTPHMTMMFEVEDLLVASPATVSRCGMVYMEPTSLGITPLLYKYYKGLPVKLLENKNFMPLLTRLFDSMLQPLIDTLRRSCKEPVASTNQNLTQSLMKLLNCYFFNYVESEIRKVTPEEVEQFVAEQLQGVFVFCLIWSVCCTCDTAGRDRLNEQVRLLIERNKLAVNIPPNASIYDFIYSEKKKIFHSWQDLFSGYEPDQKLAYHELMIPTIDSERSKYLTKLLLTNNYHMLHTGPTGTGKTLNVSSLLTGGALPDNYQYISITFSAQTSANQTQDTIDSKLEKIKRGVYGAPVGKKYIVFVDDFNMPKKEEFGAQPPLEIVRQFLDHGGWYNRRDLQWIKIEGLIVLAAMGLPGGGRSRISDRVVRQFNQLAYTDLDNKTVSLMFSVLTNNFLKRFSEEVRAAIPMLVQSVLELYGKIKSELLPTPKKSHYTFNLRDISKVFQGICNASIKYNNTLEAIIRVWYHENMRVFSDRLIEDDDRMFIRDSLAQNFKMFGVEEKTILNAERIIFCDFYLGKDVDPRHYMQASDMKQLMQKLYDMQEEYNADPKYSGSGGKNKMKLVLFLDACEHISRICRVLRQPLGNALLLGVGGSGRQSLAKLATFISNYNLFQIEVIKGYNMKTWREDIKKCLMQAGIENKMTTFLFADTQIINEQMLEDLNSVLNSGDVTGVYTDKDMEEIVSTCKSDCLRKGLQPNKMNIFTQYLLRIKNNIHIIIAMSPLGEAFSTRLRMFPSLVNCCTLDWFTEWPEEALLAVGQGQLQVAFEEENNTELLKIVSPIVEIFKTIHKSVEDISVDYRTNLSRHNYVTPTSYLELLRVFRIILKEKTNQLIFSINRLKKGLHKLIQANQEVSQMQIMLKDLQPQLEKSAKDTEELMIVLEKEKKEAEQYQKVVQEEEADATKQAAEAMSIAKEVEEKVSEANARLAESLKAVSMLKTDHLVEMKALKAPPKTTVIVLGGCVVFFQDIILKENGGEITMRKIEGTIKKEEDWLTTARLQLLENPKNFLEQLKTYDKEHINQALIAKFKQKILSDPDYTDEKAAYVGGPTHVLYMWSMAMYTFNDIYLKTQPLREQEAAVKQLVAEKNKMLADKKKSLAEVIEKIRGLEASFKECVEKKETLTKNIQECEIKLERAKKLTSGLSDEKERWAVEVQRLEAQQVYIPGNSILSAGMIAYAGAFTSDYRQRLTKNWLKKMTELSLLYQPGTSLVNFLGKPVVIQQWNMAGLPKDDNSIENGIIIDKSRRWPLMIDPQNQANKYIKNMGKETHEQGIEVMKATDHTLMKTLELAVQHGKWVLIENVGRELDPSLEPILLQQVTKSPSGLCITIGQKVLTYDESFKFFMTTTQPNPHYSPETFVKVAIINFAITPQGLEDQMLAELVALENPQLEQKKKDIVKRNAADKKELLNIEDSILQSLSQGSGGIAELLLDETLINQLQNSKHFASEINQRMKDSKITEEQIDKSREGYRSVAYRTSILFFCIVDLAGIDPMYQYSLQWFINLFKMAVENALPAKELAVRLTNLINYFTYSLYENVCRSLFEKHKLLFSFMLTVKIEFGKKQMDPAEWRYLLAGPTGDIKIVPNPTKWIDDNSWPDIFRQFHGMDQLPAFTGIYDHFMNRCDEFRHIFDSLKPHEEELPAPWNTKLNAFEKMIVLKAIRLDKVLPGIENWISAKMGKEFIIPPTFDLAKCYKDSTILTPLIFLLSPGSDPVADFLKFAKETESGKKYDSISLGQGQGVKAEKMIKDATLRGGWVLLQNCHLAASWMPDLERIVEDLDENIHKDFRLWLTSMPTQSFPISVLQNGVKMTIEPPQGLRANLLRSYANISEDQLNSCRKGVEFRKLLFGFCFFHAIIQDRRKFGAIGWNIPYEFTNEDLSVCKRQLKMLLDQYDTIPFKVLNYLGAEINYGGRVTDDKDVRLITTILKSYITDRAFKQDYKYSKSGLYYPPSVIEHSEFVSYIEGLPLNPAPEVFGLHQNAEITTNQNRTLNLLESLLSLQPKNVDVSASSSEGSKTAQSSQSREDILTALCSTLQKKCPNVFPLEQISAQYPTDYNESMNTVLVQEIVRYNRLLEVVKVSLMNFKKAIKGIVVMSEDLEKMGNSLYNNQVPKMWADRGFLSLKPLSSWLEDLIKRVNFLSEWVANGTPKVFWISGLFFPQAFITGMLQNYARKEVIAIDKVSFDFIYMDQMNASQVTQRPDSGCYIYGLFLEGCRWDPVTHMLAESKPKELFSDLPMVHLIPRVDRETPKEKVYHCPLYKVVSRAGTLSTTGHSTNFVMFLELPTIEPEEAWIKAGVASFLALRY